MAGRPRLIAFYLPQFHPIPENDAWWGRGFTEWTNVTKAAPLFRGHYQPHLPADLGFYDLRLAAARQAQADLARAHDIHGFCYFHYWFHGRRLLQTPFDEVRSSGAPDFPFCLCWANESWTRAWDGGDRDILVEATYSEDDDLAHIRWLAAAFQDARYIRVDGRPLFLVYRASRLPDARRATARWREEAVRLGIGELFLGRVESFDERGDPADLGFDAAVEFQPDAWRLGAPLSASPEWTAEHGTSLAERGHRVFTYADVAAQMLASAPPPYRRLPCVMPGWDNSARRDRGALILHDARPEIYGRWLREVLDREKARASEPIVFVNAWNEWAEGNHLEPCRRWGTAFLVATRDALAGRDTARTPGPAAPPSITTPVLHYTIRYDDPDHAHVLTLDLMKGSRRVLDVGAATGYLSEAMAAQGASVVAVEIDPASAAIARGRGADVRVGTVDETVAADEMFDAILVADVLEHVADADAFLRSLLRHLTADGRLVLSVPNVAHYTMRWALASGRFDYADTGLLDRTHLRFYTQASLERLLRRHGLAVETRRSSIDSATLRPLRLAVLDRARRRALRLLADRAPGIGAYQFIWRARRG